MLCCVHMCKCIDGFLAMDVKKKQVHRHLRILTHCTYVTLRTTHDISVEIDIGILGFMVRYSVRSTYVDKKYTSLHSVSIMYSPP